MNNYIKEHYLKKEIKFNKEEVELLTAVLKEKNMNFKEYTIDSLKKDVKKIKGTE